jgi:FkbM family methyltransferase
LKGSIVSIRQKLNRFYHQIRYPELRLKPLPTAFYGSSYGGWSVYAKALNSQSIVYSFGVGEDISFDLDLMRQHNCPIYAFDPTPRSIAWVKSQSLPPEFRLQEYGIAAYDGNANFFAPENPSHISHTMLQKEGAAITVPVKRLKTIMRELEHSHLDLLKMDIEGAEYAVLEDILDIPIKQLLVEFHHRWDGIGFEKTLNAIRLLKKHGFHIFAISPRLEEFSFIKDSK